MRALLFGLLLWLACTTTDGSECLEQEKCGGVGWPQVQSKTLWNGVQMPRVGFGTAAMRGAVSKRSVREALEAGFRHFDGAEATEWYDDASVGEAVEEFLQTTNEVTRQDLFLVSKVHPKNLGSQNTRAAIEKMLVTLRTPYLDLVLLHFPICGHWIDSCKGIQVEGTWLDSWRVLEEYYTKGTIRAIGLSNFDADELTQALEQVNVKPHVIQNWMDPFHQDRRVREICHQHDIAYTSYSTLGSQWEYRAPKRNLVRENPVINQVANRLGVEWSDVALRWALQNDAIVLPRSTNPAHIRKNAELLNSNCKTIDDPDMDALNDLPPAE